MTPLQFKTIQNGQLGVEDTDEVDDKILVSWTQAAIN